MRTTRREFLGAAACGALLPLLPRTEDAAAPTLVLLQLTGGNDGVGTLIPWSSALYHDKRPTLAVAERDVRKLDERVGLHPVLSRLERLFRDGDLAIVQGVGYPNPIRSHFRSLDVWHTGRWSGRVSGPGWIARLCDEALPDATSPELVVHVGERLPYALRSPHRPPLTLSAVERYRWIAADPVREALRARARLAPREEDAAPRRVERLRQVMLDADESSARIRDAVAAYEPRAEYPRSELARRLVTAAATLAAGLGTRVLSLELEGFDTHGGQARTHTRLLRELDAALAAFHADLDRRGLLERVVILVFSEFGRRVKENASRGTDHGTAGPAFVLGGGVRGGLHGEAPAMADLEEYDLEFTTDFRSVYASVIERCFDLEPRRVLGASYAPLELFTPR